MPGVDPDKDASQFEPMPANRATEAEENYLDIAIDTVHYSFQDYRCKQEPNRVSHWKLDRTLYKGSDELKQEAKFVLLELQAGRNFDV